MFASYGCNTFPYLLLLLLLFNCYCQPGSSSATVSTMIELPLSLLQMWGAQYREAQRQKAANKDRRFLPSSGPIQELIAVWLTVCVLYACEDDLQPANTQLHNLLQIPKLELHSGAGFINEDPTIPKGSTPNLGLPSRGLLSVEACNLFDTSHNSHLCELSNPIPYFLSILP